VELDDDAFASGKLRLRQKSGNANALGLVKFMFPNEFNVYLHDTPTGHLFDRTRRDFSHGCIRVERPAELAQYVLEDNGDWPRERIEQAMADGENDREVKLARPVPVRIVYLTAWVDADGILQFRNDIYGHDQGVKS
jgi:murein L,D-transpeptidase YcbB/YkuD